MPNGVDKNLQRIKFACASYRREHGEWPQQLRLSPAILHNLVQLLDEENFVRLAEQLEIRTKGSFGISVSGKDGVLVYEGPEPDARDELVLAERWLNISIRRELQH